jgi:hypothetical protein
MLYLLLHTRTFCLGKLSVVIATAVQPHYNPKTLTTIQTRNITNQNASRNKLGIEKNKSPVLTKLSNALLAESSDWSPKTLKISHEAMIDVLHKALLGFFIAFTTINITFSL